MVCEANDVVCHITGFISENGLALVEFAGLIEKELTDGEGIWGQTATFLKENFQAIIALAGGSFGIWKWLHYREKILHERLAEYLDDEETRLKRARSDVLEAIDRPRPGHRFTDPIFSSIELKRVLRERRWNTASDMFSLVAQSANISLDAAIKKIDGQISSAEKALSSHRDQLASAHVLRGAIASASAKIAPSTAKSHDLNSQALDQFRTALQVPGFSRDFEAKEYEAHQLRKLGRLDLAKAAYEELERRADSIKVLRTRALHIARCRRYRAELRQTDNIQQNRDGGAGGEGALAAFRLMTSNDNSSKGALVIREKHAPYTGWDSIEQGDMHYLTALICNKLGFSVRERSELDAANTEYGKVSAQHSTMGWFSGEANRRLLLTARAGAKRIPLAKAGQYDTEWLLPPSLQNAKNNAQPKRTASSN